jgi:modulator of FtsH protease HflK
VENQPQPGVTRKSTISDGSQALLNTLRLGLFSLRVIILSLFAIYLVSGIFVVKPNEKAFILRFGKIVGETKEEQVAESGEWHWAWPKPIDEVIRVPVKQSRTIHTEQFWYNDKNPESPTREVTPNANKEPLVPGLDGYLLTGDINILHCKWSLTYVVHDLIDYHSNHKDPEDAIRRILEKVVLHEAARTTIDNALYIGAEEFRLNIQDNVGKRLARLEVGITVKNVTFDRREPPRSTIHAFRKVMEAGQEKSREMNDAKGYANRLLQQAKARSTNEIAGAESYRKRVVASVEADGKYFLKILKEFQKSPETMLITLYSNGLNDVLGKVENKYIIHTDADGAGQEIRLHLGPDPRSFGPMR